MNTKLTLTVDKAVINRAKSYAKQTGRSLSELVENYLDKLSEEQVEYKLSPKLRKIAGSVKLPKDFDEKSVLQKQIEKKHL